jgi:hypothetical protein
MDLNLDHYSLEDLLKLFKLPEQFTEADLKEARKRVVAVHPDKSGLDKEYFLFFHKAYSLLTSVHSFKRKAQANMYETQSFETILESMEETDKRLLAERFSANTSFLKEFNTLFETLYMKEEDGYGDWLQSNEDLDQSFEERKKQSRAMVVSTIDAANTPYYSDLKSVYTVDTVIGVSEADYRRGFSTVEELKQDRSKQIIPLQREQAEELLSRQEEEESRLATERAFRLLQEEKVNQKKQQSFWSQLLRLQ